MAIETVKVIKINVDDARKSIKELKKDIEDQAIALAKMTEGTEEYDKAAAKLAADEKVLADATSLVRNANVSASDSYNSLQKQLTQLKREYKSLSAEERANTEVGKAKLATIAQLDRQLKAMDAEMGVYTRNVGNYGNALGQAFTQAGTVIGGPFAKAVKSADGAMKLMATNPVGAMLTLLLPLIIKVTEAFKSSEDNANALTLAFAPLKAAGDAVTLVFQAIGKAVGEAVTWVTKLLDKWGLLTDKMKERQDITAEEIALSQRQRDVDMQNADAQLKIAQLRAEANKKTEYSAKQRLDMLTEAVNLEAEISRRDKEIAEQQYNVLKRKAALTANSKEANDQLAAAYVKMRDAETQYYQTTIRLNSQIATLKKEIMGDAAGTVEAVAAELGGLGNAVMEEYADEVEAYLAEQQRLIDESGKQFDEAEKEWQAKRKEQWQAAAKAYAEAEKEKQEAAKRTQKIEQASFKATSTILSAMADAMAASEEGSRRNAEQIKNLRTAAAIIDTLQAGLAAYRAGVEIGGVAGLAVGAAQMAAALATGWATVKKIQATDVSGTSAGGAAVAQPAAVTAPNIIMETPVVRTLTTSSEEQRLNRMAADQRVYVVYSDIEGAGRKAEVTDKESTF